MVVDYNVSEVEEFARNHGGKNIDIGYESMGDYTQAFIEVEFDETPDLSLFSDADNVEIDEEWGEDKVMFEVVLNTR